LRWRLSTPRGPVEAADILVATSGLPGAVTQALRRRIVPLGSYVIVTERCRSRSLARSALACMMYNSRHFLHYFPPDADRRLLFGGARAFVRRPSRR